MFSVSTLLSTLDEVGATDNTLAIYVSTVRMTAKFSVASL